MNLRLKLVVISQLGVISQEGNKSSITPIFSGMAVFWIEEDEGISQSCRCIIEYNIKVPSIVAAHIKEVIT